MVIYKLGIYIKDNVKTFNLRQIINIDSLKSLQDIDKFTSKFESENELKEYLLSKNALSKDEIQEKIHVLYKNNGEIRTLPVIYSKQNQLLNIGIIKMKLKSLATNIKFFEKLLEHYDFYQYERNPQKSNILNIKLYLNDIYKDGKKAINYDRELIEKTLDNFVLVATRSLDKKTNNYKFNYRGFRDLALLIYNFEEIEKLKELKINIKQEEDSEDEKETLARLNGKWILSSEGDPDFPFNSEEEKMSIEYEENILNSINSNDYDEEDDYTKYRK